MRVTRVHHANLCESPRISRGQTAWRPRAQRAPWPLSWLNKPGARRNRRKTNRARTMSRARRGRVRISRCTDASLFLSVPERGYADVPRGEEPGRRDQGVAVLARQAALRQAAHPRRR